MKFQISRSKFGLGDNKSASERINESVGTILFNYAESIGTGLTWFQLGHIFTCHFHNSHLHNFYMNFLAFRLRVAVAFAWQLLVVQNYNLDLDTSRQIELDTHRVACEF